MTTSPVDQVFLSYYQSDLGLLAAAAALMKTLLKVCLCNYDTRVDNKCEQATACVSTCTQDMLYDQMAHLQ
jgi:hypothetical protein